MQRLWSHRICVNAFSLASSSYSGVATRHGAKTNTCVRVHSIFQIFHYMYRYGIEGQVRTINCWIIQNRSAHINSGQGTVVMDFGFLSRGVGDREVIDGSIMNYESRQK